MKILFRILVILVVASFVTGALYMLVNMSGASTSNRPREFAQNNGTNLQPPSGEVHPQFDRRRERSGGIIGLPFGMVRNLAVISFIAAIYLNAGRLFKRKTVATTK
jgi:hypothetical protein